MSFLVPLALIALAIVALEGLAWVLAALSDHIFDGPIPRREAFLADQSRKVDALANGKDRRDVIHPRFGWTLRAGYQSESDPINAQSLRSRDDYPSTPRPGVKRIATFGDSFVYGTEVAIDGSWPVQIEAGWNAEVLNYGVGGYGTDQAFLRFVEEGMNLHPQVVIIGFTPMMAPRVISRYRRFRDHRDGPWFKPRFTVTGGELRLIPPPVASREDALRLLENPASVVAFGEEDGWYNRSVFESSLYDRYATYRLLSYTWLRIRRRYLDRGRIFRNGLLNPESESFQLLERIFGQFTAAVRSAGAEPVVLMLPTRDDLLLYRRRGVASYETLRVWLEAHGETVVDAARALTSAELPAQQMFRPGGHYTDEGNALVASLVAESLGLARRS